jgi:hypothetical protein
MYCDNCGEKLFVGFPHASLPADVESANKGESAVLCLECHEDLIKENNQ